MDCENAFRLEKELLNDIEKRKKYSLVENLSHSKELLRKQVGRNGDNLYDILVRLVSNLLDNPPPDVVDHFEEYCRLAKIDFLSTDRTFFQNYGSPRELDSTTQKQILLAHQTLQTLNQLDEENIRCCPEFVRFVRYGLNSMGWDLPKGYDYFISAQIERTLCNNRSAKSCQFWGIVRSLYCDYYILELEHREKSVDYCAHRGVIGKHPEIITDIIDGLLEASLQRTKSATSIDNLSVLSGASLENVTHSMILEIVKKLELVDSEIEEAHCRADIGALLAEMIDHLSCISSETLESSLTMPTTDPCASPRSHDVSTASLLRIQLERIQLEARLNSRTFLVTENPRTKPWQELPHVTLEQLQATEGFHVFLTGDLQAVVPSVVKPFDGVEKNLLRALIAKISAHRDGHIDGSETNISLVRCLSGTYGSLMGYDQELLHERTERWWERKQQCMQYWLSEIWPGLCTFNDGEQFRCFYVGWGMERPQKWYNPIVRIPKIMDEFVPPVRTSETSQEESKCDATVLASSSKESFE